MNERTFHASGADRLDDPQRLEWMPPGTVIARLGITAGMHIADIGAGTGYFTLPIARAAGPEGSVFAVDMQKEMLDRIRTKAARPGSPANIILVEGEAAASRLAGNSVDLVLMSNVWHELDDTARVLVEVRRVVRPGGRLAILDWRADLVPPPGPPAGHRVSAEHVIRDLASSGWRTGYPDSIGQYSYLVIAYLS